MGYSIFVVGGPYTAMETVPIYKEQSHPPCTHGVITITLPPVGSLEDCMEVCLNM